MHTAPLFSSLPLKFDVFDIMDWFVILVVFGPFLIPLGYWAYKNYTMSVWESGQFFEESEYNNDNLLQAYICLSAWMLKHDRRSTSDKIFYMNRYFRSHFSDRDFKESLNYAYENPVYQGAIAAWLNIHLKKEERSQLLQFLVGFSLIDGSMNSEEEGFINNIRHIIGVSEKELKSIVASYHQQRHRKHAESSSTSSSTSADTKKTALKLSYEIIGVSEFAAMDEVKKAYRSLVKKHHPDRFATSSLEQQKIAESRFIEIQKAYEIIEKYK